MVASKRLGLVISELMVSLFRSFAFSRNSLSLGLSEKKATSEPETSAEQTNSTSMVNNATVNSIDSVKENELESSIVVIRSKGSSNVYSFREYL